MPVRGRGKKRGQVVGCVPYLNAKPLIHGLADERTRLLLEVPSKLVDRVRSGACDVALCSVIDACRDEGLVVVPCGAIACAGPTWTVRLFSRVPIERLSRVHLDTDSHTSVMLLRVLLAERYGVEPETVDFDFRGGLFPKEAEAALLIGDKVVTSPPPEAAYPYTLDLGEQWHAWTGEPFVFAAWVARRDADLGELPARLTACRTANAQPEAIEAMLDRFAAAHGWPRDMARAYWTSVLRYTLGDAERRGLTRFVEACQRWRSRHPEHAALGPVRFPRMVEGPDVAATSR